MYFGMRCVAIMSHGWTNTAAPSLGAMMQESDDAGIIEILFPDVITDFDSHVPGAQTARQFRAGRVNILQRHLAQRLQSSVAPPAHFQSCIIEKARAFQRVLRFAVVSEKHRSGGNNLLVDSVAIHLLQTHTYIPACRIYPAKFPVAQHDYGLAGFGVLDPWPIGRAEARRQVRPGLWKKMRVNVGDWHLHLRFAKQLYLGAGLPG